MRYFLIAGEASGDLHAAHLMSALKQRDAAAEFFFYGGDKMAAEGGTLLCHYRHLAYMGFIPVLLHARTILRGMKTCRQQIRDLRPDVLVLIDYPGFNLKMAQFVRKEHICPVFYYISPKIWAWKEHRIKAIKRDVDRLYSILPFETDWFRDRHGYEVTYVGNPTVDEVEAFKVAHPAAESDARLVALLPGSRRQEVNDNLSIMLEAVRPLAAEGYRFALALAPSLPRSLYADIVRSSGLAAEKVEFVEGNTYGVLSQAVAALVTSGTATLETALFRVPQVVCYYTACGRFVSFLRRHLLHVPYISLVNLVGGEAIVEELVADGMTVANVEQSLRAVLPDGPRRARQLEGYEAVASRLGGPGAAERAAADMVGRLKGEGR